MDLIVIGQGVDATDSTELQFAQQQFLAHLPLSISVVRTDAQNLPALELAALKAAEQKGMGDGARVLLARHAYLWLAPGTLHHLAAALDQGANVAYAYDSTQPCPDLPPDYLTVRGMERYALRLAAFPNRPFVLGTPLPQLALSAVGAMRGRGKPGSVQWVACAFAHDFSAYHQGRRDEVIPLVPATVRRVLDVGGGEGGFLAALKSHLGCETHLAEFSSAACAVAATCVDTVWPGDFMQAALNVKFDCITFLDVLEHSEWPARWLKRAVELLEPDGCIVMSIPNVGHWSVILDLLEGRWDYAPAGIHCVTHLRFFTRFGIEQLMAEVGLQIDRIETARTPMPDWFDTSSMQRNILIDTDSLSVVAFLVRARRTI